jgi:hypothetical protein
VNNILGAAMFMALAVAAHAESPQDFAYRVELEAVPGLNVITLDEAVYRAASTANLHDLRVFNADGRALPLAALPAPPIGAGAIHELRMVALPAQAPARDKALADFALRIGRQGAQAVIELKPAPAQTPSAGDEIGGYLLDLRQHRGRDGEIQLQFYSDAPDFTGRIEFLGSDDLYAWRSLASGALVRNRQLGDTIERSAFPLGRLPPFMRIAWSNTATPRLESARLVERGAAPALPRAQLSVARAETGKSWFVDVPPALPIALVHVRAPRDNAVVRVQVFRFDDREPRQRARIGLHARRAPEHWVAEGGPRDVFRLQRDGLWIEGAPFVLSARTTQLRIDAPDGAGFGDALPIVEVEWVPQRFVVAVDGPPPYQLAVGNETSDLKPGPTLDTRSVLPQSDVAGTRLPQAVAKITPTSNVGKAESGPQRAQRIARQATWSRYVLWGVLFVAVVALAFMAWRIASQVRRAQPEAPGAESGAKS